MVKSIDYITIRNFALFEKTGKARHLMWLPLPPGLYRKKLRLVVEEIRRNLSPDIDQDQNLLKEGHRIKSLYRIQKLTVLYSALYNLMINKEQVNVWQGLIKEKLYPVENLEKYQQKVKDATGFEVNKIEDLKKLKDAIDRWTSKYRENFVGPEYEDKGKKLTFMQLAMGVFAAMNMNIDYRLSLADFFQLKEQAEETARKLSKLKDKNG